MDNLEKPLPSRLVEHQLISMSLEIPAKYKFHNNCWELQIRQIYWSTVITSTNLGYMS